MFISVLNLVWAEKGIPSLFSMFLVMQVPIFISLYHAGKWLCSRQIRCNWATKGAGTNEDKLNSDSKSVVELTNGSSGRCDLFV